MVEAPAAVQRAPPQRRELATARKRRYRANLAAGQVVARAVVSNPLIGLLLDTQWLVEPENEQLAN
jgi:hypothetical protein